MVKSLKSNPFDRRHNLHSIKVPRLPTRTVLSQLLGVEQGVGKVKRAVDLRVFPTSRAESGVLVVSVKTVGSAVAEVLYGDAGAVAGTLERLVRVTGFTYNSTKGRRKEWSPCSK